MNVLKTFLLTQLLSIFSFSLQAQSVLDSPYLDIHQLRDSISVSKCLTFIDNDSIENVSATLLQKWSPLSDYKPSSISREWVSKTVYLCLDLTNSDNKSDTVYLYPGLLFRSIKTYKQVSDTSLELVEDKSQKDGFQPLVVKNGEKQSFILALKPAKASFNYLRPVLIKKDFVNNFKKVNYHKNSNQQAVGYLLSGFLLMMFFFSLVNYFLSRKKEFLFNSCYAGCSFLLIFFITYFERRSGVLASFFESYAAFILLATGIIFYIAFTRKFINTAQDYPKLDKVFLIEEWGAFITILIFSYLYFFTENVALQRMLENLLKITALIIGVIYIVFAFIQQKKILNYLAIGNLLLILGSFVSYYYLLHPTGRKSIFSSAIFYYESGIVAEMMFFLMALTLKNRNELIIKIREQEALKLEAEKLEFETKLAVINGKQKERNRISADMHDELGAGITAIRLYSELAKSKADGEALPEVEKISDSANELLTNMNAIIWAMSSNNDSLENMVAYIRSYALEYFENTGIKCRINLMENIPDITVWGEFRKNVFMVIKESLNNILKHSKATEVTITLAQVPDGISLYIQDNGVGIDTEKLRRFGNGLKNMKKRMEDMNISFNIENKNGTLITLHYSMQL